jgi:hypothetical protein
MFHSYVSLPVCNRYKLKQGFHLQRTGETLEPSPQPISVDFYGEELMGSTATTNIACVVPHPTR